MKLRTLLLLIAGICIGYVIAKKAREDDPNVVKGPQRDLSNGTGGGTVRTITTQAQRLADQAATRSLGAIRRARGSIRARVSSGEDDGVWN